MYQLFLKTLTLNSYVLLYIYSSKNIIKRFALQKRAADVFREVCNWVQRNSYPCKS